MRNIGPATKRLGANCCCSILNQINCDKYACRSSIPCPPHTVLNGSLDMNWRFLGVFALGFLILGLSQPASARADELPDEVQKSVDRGLDWLARTQSRDGHWDAN